MTVRAFSVTATRLGAALAGLVLAGCGGADEPVTARAETQPAVRPADFAVRHCSGAPAAGPCLIVEAGGKTLLFGAPEGAMAALHSAGRDIPDAVFLGTLGPTSLEGLARVRNRSWALGRTAPLAVTGPEGLTDIAGHLDAAFEHSDALVHLQAEPPGGFDAAPLAPLDILPGQAVRVFDTGDLVVEAGASLRGDVTYLVSYAAQDLLIEPCAAPSARAGALEVDLRIVCVRNDESYSWPFDRDIHILNRASR